jgi:phosphatidylinositol alpha-1,6-mannosyltransferase
MYIVVTRAFPPEIGGMQNLMWGLTNSLSKHYMIKVFADYHVQHQNYDKSVSFSIQRVGGIKLLRKYRKAYLVNEFIKKNKNIKGIIADHWKSLELIKTDKKKICLIHSKEINYDKGTYSNKRILKVLNNVDHIVSNSKYTKDLAINCGVNSDKIKVINPGIDSVKEIDKKMLNEAEMLLKNKNPRLVTVSRLDKRKNHEKIIMALRNLKQIYPNIIYTCIGYGKEEENIKTLVKELNLDQQFLFFKGISQDLKNALVSKSNLFVMPSIIYKKSVEGFGIAFVEAAQYGISSIGGKDGGASDAIEDGKSGKICDGNNLDEIYSNINQLLTNNSYLEFGKYAKSFVKKFEWEKIIEDYKKIL